MTDKELLTLAAKAYWGAEIDDVCSIRWLEVDQAIGYTHADNQDHNGRDVELLWNPLVDDGNAFRLAVRLVLEIRPGAGVVTAAGNGAWEEVDIGEGSREEATRRAIVQAAAMLPCQN